MIMHNRNNERDKMQLWQTFTIEPILCTGSPRHRVWPDKWTVSLPQFCPLKPVCHVSSIETSRPSFCTPGFP